MDGFFCKSKRCVHPTGMKKYIAGQPIPNGLRKEDSGILSNVEKFGQRITWNGIILIGLLCFFWFLIFNYFSRPRFSEGFNDANAEHTYFPQKMSTLKEPSAKYFINDFMRDAMELPECIKVYKELLPPNDGTQTSSTNEYSTKTITETEIYKKYKNDLTEEKKAKIAMDGKYSELFKKETFIQTGTESQVVDLKEYKKKVDAVLLFDNRLHNFIQYSTIHPFESPFSFTEFSDYFATIIHKYHKKANQLDQIQAFMYKLLTPLYLYSKFIDHFVANQSIYTQKDDLLYVLNTTTELLKAIKIEEFPHSAESKTVYIFQDDKEDVVNKTLTVDSLTVFSVMYILLNLRKVFQPGGSKLAQIKDDELSSIFQTYLDKKFPDSKTKSVLTFAVHPKNAPTLPDEYY